MFGNIKDLVQMQSRAKEIQKKLSEETVTAEKNGVKIIMNGNQEVLSVEIASELVKENLENNLRDAFNDAVKKVQMLMAKQMMGM
jgi:DNA-binding YbaB/EbfC family protein